MRNITVKISARFIAICTLLSCCNTLSYHISGLSYSLWQQDRFGIVYDVLNTVLNDFVFDLLYISKLTNTNM